MGFGCECVWLLDRSGGLWVRCFVLNWRLFDAFFSFPQSGQGTYANAGVLCCFQPQNPLSYNIYMSAQLYYIIYEYLHAQAHTHTNQKPHTHNALWHGHAHIFINYINRAGLCPSLSDSWAANHELTRAHNLQWVCVCNFLSLLLVVCSSALCHVPCSKQL